jgi:hypothetical protein
LAANRTRSADIHTPSTERVMRSNSNNLDRETLQGQKWARYSRATKTTCVVIRYSSRSGEHLGTVEG